MLLVTLVFAFILVAILLRRSFEPLSFAMLHTIRELSDVRGTRAPFVLAKALRFTFVVGTGVAITVSE